jgi:hypothetical protein
MTPAETVTIGLSVLTAAGISYRLLDSLQTKKEDEKRRVRDEELRVERFKAEEKRRAEDERLRQERVEIVDAAFERLEDISEDVHQQLKRINGTVQRHDVWIEEHRRLTDPAMDAFHVIKSDVNLLKDQMKSLQGKKR